MVLLTTALPLRARHDNVFFIPNHGQWDSRVQHVLKLNYGNMYFEKTGLTWLFTDLEMHGGHGENIQQAQFHALKMEYVDANAGAKVTEGDKTDFYYNFFLGKDPAKWKSGIFSAYDITKKDIYPHTDIRFYGTDKEELKYDYIVHPGGNPALIRHRYTGAEKVFISNGDLHIKTPLGTVIEKKPVAWQIINGKKKPVNCRFAIQQGDVVFEFPGGYNTAYDLVIDPVLIFSSFTGSTADNFGFTATYDSQKDTYAGGIVFSLGVYPTTAGAFQPAYGGGTVDAAISKFNVAGSALMFSTYLGGDNTDAPHSLVVDANDDLFVLGSTGSSNFPVTAGCYDNTYGGGIAVAPPASGTNYTTGSDIFVTKFNPTGTALAGSTYIGGTGNDGLNMAGTLTYNYGDVFRGEIIAEPNGDCILASTTSSADFPLSGNAPQPVFGGGASDGVVCRLNPSLTSLLWSTYFGGNQPDASYSVQTDSNGDIYVSGGTQSPNLLVSPGVIGPAFSGSVDGYIVRYSSNGNSILACTYIGTPAYDQTYFVQLDQQDDVYVLGQSTGGYAVTAGVYNNFNSGQFVHQVNNTFTATVMSTTIGRSMGSVDISPCAFLVNKCGHIYISGWGGSLNGLFPYQALSSSTLGMPVTPDAIQLNSDGSDFYLMILSEDAQQLLYATFFGGAGSANEHVDGGTSRFDKDGVVYQAVCGGCGGTSNFPTTPGAWSQTNNSSNCNLAVFKIDLKEIIAEADFVFQSNICALPVTVSFDNQSVGAISYYWDFDDGDTSTLENPTHVFQNPGTYQVALVALDSNTCNGADTAYIDIFIPGPLSVTISPFDTICQGDTTQISVTAAGGQSYQWSPATGLSSTTVANPFANPPSSTLYTVIAIDTNGCADTASVLVEVLPFVSANFTPNFTPCSIPVTVDFLNGSTNGVNYIWDFDDGGAGSTQTDAQYTYNVSGTYTITLIAIDSNSCNFSDTVAVDIFLPPPASITVSGGDTICVGQSTPASASGGVSYSWSPSVWVDDPSSPNPNLSPGASTNFQVIAIDSNGCADTGYVQVDVYPPASIDAGPDQLLDVGDTPVLTPTIPTNGTFYWSPPYGLSCTNCANPVATPETSTTYYLTFTDLYGCTYTDSLIVLVTPSVFIPNAFTPNGHGPNEIFKPIVRNLSYYEFYIFNRWGELIFHTTDTEAGWDGTYKGAKCPVDVYVWKIKYSDYLNEDEVTKKYGHVTLVR
ncbi:MAG: PKD domain-containing protein [Bacteroidota bacterium]